jgi:hypothetical protein
MVAAEEYKAKHKSEIKILQFKMAQKYSLGLHHILFVQLKRV